MVIELLYHDIASLFGEKGNLDLLKSVFPEATFIETDLFDEPHFVSHQSDLILMGPTTENYQRVIIERLLPYKEKIIKEIEKGTHFWITGNALDIFGREIHQEDGEVINALDIFPFITKQQMFKRLNSFALAEGEGALITGFKTQFIQLYPIDELPVWLKMRRGFGFNLESKDEGIKVNNFIGTHILGPLLILNPHFTKNWLKDFGFDQSLPFETAMIEAYEKRLSEFEDEKIINYP